MAACAIEPSRALTRSRGQHTPELPQLQPLQLSNETFRPALQRPNGTTPHDSAACVVAALRPADLRNVLQSQDWRGTTLQQLSFSCAGIEAGSSHTGIWVPRRKYVILQRQRTKSPAPVHRHTPSPFRPSESQFMDTPQDAMHAVVQKQTRRGRKQVASRSSHAPKRQCRRTSHSCVGTCIFGNQRAPSQPSN